MGRQIPPRRHADGAPDLGYYRRRARRLRSLARRRAWRGMVALVLAAVGRLAFQSEARWPAGPFRPARRQARP